MNNVHQNCLQFTLGKLLTVAAACFLISIGIPTAKAQDSVRSASATSTATWSQWRGNGQQGVAGQSGSEASFPTTWSEDQAVKWKLAVEGKGNSTPVIDDGVAYLTTSIDDKNTLVAVSLDKGNVLWKTSLGITELGKDQKSHKKGGNSNPSAVIRDDHVFAYFRSGDLACVDKSGKIVWQLNLQEEYGEDTLWWDLGSSPMLTENSLVVAVMQTGPSYLVALDPKSGEVQWKEDRNVGAPKEAAQSYSTPIAVSAGGKDLIAVMGADHLTLHDAGTGKTLGKLGGFNPTNHEYFRSISSPVASGDLIVCPYARGDTMTCVRISDLLAGKGKSSIVWHRDDVGSDVPTPAVRDGLVFLVSDGKQTRGHVYGIDIETGKTKWTVKTPKSRNGFSSSPLVAGDSLYVTAENGTTHVIGPLSSDSPQLIQSNEVADNQQFTAASPVPYKNGLLIRTRNSLYRIE